MKILVSWLREFVQVDAGIDDLADVLTMRGFEVSAVDPVPASIRSDGDDAVLDLEVTTNRPDCLNLLGVAREVSTAYDSDLQSPALDTADVGDGESALSVVLEDAELCPRYVASLAEVTIGPSPGWLAARLEAADIRPINNVVDITNYVMLEMGHPMHAFDLEKLHGQAIKVRRATSGEKLRTLDGEERSLTPDMLVIADAERPQAVAGMMGGADSEVSGQTHLIALESAYFLPTSVRRTSKRLALSTEASYRFERGADINAPLVAMRRALTLLAQTGAGHATGSIIDEYPQPRQQSTVQLRHSRIKRILGIDIEAAFVSRTLERLGFGVTSSGQAEGDAEQRWVVSVPTHRVDVSREIDLIEEVARHYGYDRIPATFPALVRPPAGRDRWQRRQDVLRRVLTASGCSEAITYSFVERDAATPFGPATGGDGDTDNLVAIANPLSEKFAVLRPSLLPGLLDSLVRNRRREHRDVRLFEIGRCFNRRTGETGSVGIAVTGTGGDEHWSSASRTVDLFDIKGIVERTCDALGVTPLFSSTVCPVLVEGRSSEVSAVGPDGEAVRLGRLGQLTPALAAARGLPNTDDEVYVAELDLDALDSVTTDRDELTAAPVPRYPSIVRDLAVVVDHALPAAAVRGTIRAAAPDTLVSVREFDRYEGKGIPSGCISLALRLTFRASDRTLTDAEVQGAVDRVVAALEQQHEAKLR